MNIIASTSPLRVSEDTYLGPATLVNAAPGAVRAELPSGEQVSVQLALAYGYVPRVGDVIVVLGRDDRWYAIGLMQGAGDVRLRFNSDVTVRAAGALELVGERGVEIRGSAIDMVADSLSVVTDKIVEKAESMIQRVRGLASMHSGEKHEVVRGEHVTRAERAQVTCFETVSVNGKEIHLG